MRSRRRLLTSIILVPSLGSFLYLVRQQEPTAAREPFGVWSPTPAAIQQELGPPLALPFDAPMQRQRRKRFAQRFKDRYRNHADHYAVCLSFASDHRLILQTPAAWNPGMWTKSRCPRGRSHAPTSGIPSILTFTRPISVRRPANRRGTGRSRQSRPGAGPL